MTRFLVHWATTGVALWVATWLVSGVTVTSLPALAVAALVLGFVNAVIRPILTLLTLPITLLTLGLFYLVVNGVAFGLAAALTPGFRVAGVGAAILGALVVGIVSWFIGAIGLGDDHERHQRRGGQAR